MSPVTLHVHWIGCSFLDNHIKIAINGNPASAGGENFGFLRLSGPQKFAVTVTGNK
jgi:hypothetical protein